MLKEKGLVQYMRKEGREYIILIFLTIYIKRHWETSWETKMAV